MAIEKNIDEALSWRLGSFRLSDKNALRKMLETDSGRHTVSSAVRIFVEKWNSADWFEEYSVRRIGKWLVKNAPDNVVDELVSWAKATEGQGSNALIDGITAGQEEKLERA